MTIAVGFKCRDGIVLATDRQLSGPIEKKFDTVRSAIAGLAWGITQPNQDEGRIERLAESLSQSIRELDHGGLVPVPAIFPSS